MAHEEFIKCNSCEKKLMAIIVAKPDPQLSYKFKCTCPFCGGSSDIKEIKGIFFQGPVDPSISTNPTIVANVIQEDEYTIFEIKKRI